jgi:hypothetical protein
VKPRPVFGANMAIFVLFFGLAVIEAIRLHAWWRVTFWLAISMVFLFADLSRPRTSSQTHRK